MGRDSSWLSEEQLTPATGNELSVNPWTYSGWTETVSRYIRIAQGAKQLVVDGYFGKPTASR